MKYRIVLVLVFAILLILPAIAQEEQQEKKKTETEHTIYIPYKDLEKVFEKTGRGVFMPYEEFIKLWEKARQTEKLNTDPSVSALVTGASYECNINETIASVGASLSVEVLKEGWVELPLGISGIALEDVKLDGGKALLKAREDDYLLILKSRGAHELKARFATKVESAPDKRIISFGVPRTPVSRLQITIPEPDVEVEIEPKLLATKTVTPEGDKTTVLAFVGNTDKIKITYKPREKVAAPLEGLFFSTVSTDVNFQERLISVGAKIDYEILEKLNQLKVKLPGGWRLLSVEGPDIKDWRLEENEQRIIVVDLFAEAKKSYTLHLQIEKEIEKTESVFEMPAIEVIGATRESGFFILRADEGIRIEEAETQNVNRVDEADFELKGGEEQAELAFKYLRHPYKLSIKVTEVQPRISLRNDSLITITREFVTLECQLRYTVEKRGIFSTSVELPEHYVVIKAGDPVFVKDYRVKQIGGSQVLSVDFKARLIGSFILPLVLQRPRTSVDEPVYLPFARGLDASVESGFIGLGVKSELKVLTEESSGLIPVNIDDYSLKVADLNSSEDSPLQLAYQFYKHPFSAKFSVELKKPKVLATIETLLSIQEETVNVQGVINYKIHYTGINTLRFSIADELGKTAHITGVGIKEKKHEVKDGVTIWDIKLQGEALGNYVLRFSYDIKISASTHEKVQAKIPETAVLDVFEERGFFGLVKDEILVVGADYGGSIEPNDVKELPEALMETSPYESYKYVSHPYSLELSILKQEFEKVLSALVTHMHIETEISNELVATSKMICLIQSKGRQFLTFLMPEGSEILALYVNKKEAKRSRGETSRHAMINLSEAAPGQTTFYVEIAYKKNLGEGGMPAIGTIRNEAPVPLDNMPLSRLTMRLYMPKGYKYTSFGGNMRRIEIPLENSSVWFWGKKLIFPVARLEASDYEISNEIRGICDHFAKSADMITVKLTREGEEFSFLRQGAGGIVNAGFFGKKLFYAFDILILIATFAGLMALGRFVTFPKIAIAATALIVFMILATLASGETREFLNTAFLGSLFVSLLWALIFMVTAARSLPRRPVLVVSGEVQDLEDKSRRKDKPESTDETSPDEETGEEPEVKGGGSDA